MTIHLLLQSHPFRLELFPGERGGFTARRFKLSLGAFERGVAFGSGGLQFGQLDRVGTGGLGLSRAGQVTDELLAFRAQASVVAGAQFSLDLGVHLVGKSGFEREGVLTCGAVDGVFSLHTVEMKLGSCFLLKPSNELPTRGGIATTGCKVSCRTH